MRVERVEAVVREILAKVDSLSLIQSSEGEAQKQLTTVVGKLDTVTQRHAQMTEDYFASPSTGVAQMIARLETEQATLRDEKERLRETLATSQVVSKEEFFGRLDLVSFEGRHAANSLLKRLGVNISVLSEESAEQWYMVKTEARTLFAIFHRSDEISIRSLDSRILDLQLLQGEIGETDRARFEGVAELVKVEVEKLLSKMLPAGCK